MSIVPSQPSDENRAALRATARLIASLRDPARSPLFARQSSPSSAQDAQSIGEGRTFEAGVEVIETHVSFILLAGDRAFKIKKPLVLPFLDFSTLERRRVACEDELRLNRRTAPELYLRVVALTGSPEAPRLVAATDSETAAEGGEPIEFAVEMRRFDPDALFSKRLAEGRIEAEQVDALAERIAVFHASLAGSPAEDGAAGTKPADPSSPTDPSEEPAARIARRNLAELRTLAPTSMRERIEGLGRWLDEEIVRVAPGLAARRRAGFVRECHGDLHLANVALVDGRPVLFDCLEFDRALRQIDVLDEAAFAFMDFHAHDRPDFAARFLNAYLERTGDYEGVVGLRLFAVHRALVRLKVALIRSGQSQIASLVDAAARPEIERPLAVAERLVRDRVARLVVTCGLAGSGKTTVSSRLVEALCAIRLRSDVERKRMVGLEAAARSGSGVGEGLYDPEASRRTYRRLEALAETILKSGWSVVVDAAFLRAAERGPFRALAARLGLPFRIVVCTAPVEVLRARIDARSAQGRDASEADRAVLAHQLEIAEPPADAERAQTEMLSTDAPLEEVEAACRALGARIRAGD